MELRLKNPPREFKVGTNGAITIKDMGAIVLEPDEMVTMTLPSGKGMDVSRKSWGFYATPSVNARLKQEGFKTALVKNTVGRYFVMVVDSACLPDFEYYCQSEDQQVIQWLDEL